MDIRVDDSREITPGNDEGDTTQPCQPLLIPPKKLLLQSSKGKQTTVESTSPQTIITVFDSYTAKPKQTSDTQRDNRTLLQNMMHSLELANGPSQDVTAVRKISVSSASTSSFDCHKECLNGERQYQNGYQHEEEDDKDDDVVFVEEDSIESKQRQREALLNLYEEVRHFTSFVIIF